MYKILWYLQVTCLLALAASAKGNGAIELGPTIYAPGHASADYYVSAKHIKFYVVTCIYELHDGCCKSDVLFQTYPSYAFEYSVKDPHTGDNKAQWEKRNGDAVTG